MKLENHEEDKSKSKDKSWSFEEIVFDIDPSSKKKTITKPLIALFVLSILVASLLVIAQNRRSKEKSPEGNIVTINPRLEAQTTVSKKGSKLIYKIDLQSDDPQNILDNLVLPTENSNSYDLHIEIWENN